MLQGTIESFPLPDVMRFLSSTGKVGRLTATGLDGSVDVLVDGPTVLVSGSEMDDAAESVFEILRVKSGRFVFDDEAAMPNGLNAFPVDPVLARAGQLSVEWERVSTLVPSVHHHLTLCPELAGESLTVTRDDWRLIRRLAAGGTAGDFSGHLDVSVVAATRRLAGLVERGIAVVEAPIEPVVATPAQAAPAVVVAAPVAVTPPVATETFAPVEGDAVPEGGETVGEPVENVHASLAAFFAQDEPEDVAPEQIQNLEQAAPNLDDQSIGAVAASSGDGAGEPEQRALLYRFLSSVRS